MSERKFVVRCMGKEKVIAQSEIEKLQAAGFSVEVITEELAD